MNNLLPLMTVVFLCIVSFLIKFLLTISEDDQATVSTEPAKISSDRRRPRVNYANWTREIGVKVT